jgi:hypothetical protein
VFVAEMFLPESLPHLCKGISPETYKAVPTIANIDSSQVRDGEDMQKICTG